MTCPKAEAFAAVAREHGWGAVVATTDEMVSVTATALRYGWTLGIMVAWFRTERGWRLGELDGKRGAVVAGAAEPARGGLTQEFTLPSLRYAVAEIRDSSGLVAWLDERLAVAR